MDSDLATVSATGTDGLPVSAAALGVKGAFNFCDASPRSSSCSGLSDPYDLPGWSITLEVERQSGFPVVNVWLVSLARGVSGPVTLDGVPSSGQTVEVVAPDGRVVASVSTREDGSWTVPDLVATDGWHARVVVPVGTEAGGPTSLPVDLSQTDAVDVDFLLLTAGPEPSGEPSAEPTVEPSTEPSGEPTGRGSAEPSGTADPTQSASGTEPGVTPTGAPGRTFTGGGSTGGSGTGGFLARTGADGLLAGVLVGFVLLGTGTVLLTAARGARER